MEYVLYPREPGGTVIILFLKIPVKLMLFMSDQSCRKFVTTDGDRYFWNARYVSAIIDVPSDALVDVNRFLKNEEAIIRHHLTRLESNVVAARGKTYRNPYLHLTNPNAAPSTPTTA